MLLEADYELSKDSVIRAVCKYVVALRAFTPLQTARRFHSGSSKMLDRTAVKHFEICRNVTQLVTATKKLLVRRIGQLPDWLMDEVDLGLKLVLHLE